MNISTVIILLAIIGTAALAARKLIRDKRAGKCCGSCGGTCSGCGGTCGKPVIKKNPCGSHEKKLE